MGRNICRKQFTCRNFGFRCKEEEKSLFYRLQWCKNRMIYLVYRLFMCLYSLGWLLAYYIVVGISNPENLQGSFKFLTIWGVWSSAIYFTLSFALSVVGVSRKYRSNRLEHGSVKFLRSSTWMIFSMASVQQIVIFVVYWAFLALSRQEGTTLTTPINMHQHLVTFVMILIEIFMAAFPIRLLHAIYSMIGGAVYVVMTVLVYASGDPHVIYPFLNWKENPGLAAGVSVGLSVFGSALLQSMYFGFYCLRLTIHKRICGGSSIHSRQIPTSRSGVEAASDNPAYTIEVSENYRPQANDYF